MRMLEDVIIKPVISEASMCEGIPHTSSEDVPVRLKRPLPFPAFCRE